MASVSGGALDAGTYLYEITAITPQGETVPSLEVSVDLAAGVERSAAQAEDCYRKAIALGDGSARWNDGAAFDVAVRF